MSDAGLCFTGHALVDVGLAGVCAHAGRVRPEDVTLADLDAVSELLVEAYYSGAFGPYLSCVFMNASFVQPNESAPKRAQFIGQYLRAHRAQADARVAGARCAFSGQPATSALVRTHLPLFSGEGVLNFRPDGQTCVPAAGAFAVALMFLPLASRRAEGRLLAVHADDPALTLEFARRYLADNRRLLSLSLPAARAPVHPQFEREQPMWDAAKKRYKMADAKGPRSLIVADLTDVARRAGPNDLRPTPSALHVYWLSNSGQGPALDVLALPSGAVNFVRRAAGASTAPAWSAVSARFRPLQQADGEAEAGPPRRRGRALVEPVAGRAGWTRNPAFEDLCAIFEGGFTDTAAAQRWLRRHVLGRIESRAGDVRYEATRARCWALAELFLQEVLGMKAARIQAIKTFADKLAARIESANERRLYRSLVHDKPRELRQALLRAQRESARAAALLFGLDEYATVFLHEDGDEYVVRDLLCIRVVERLAELNWFERNPQERLDTGDDEGTEREEDEA